MMLSRTGWDGNPPLGRGQTDEGRRAPWGCAAGAPYRGTASPPPPPPPPHSGRRARERERERDRERERERERERDPQSESWGLSGTVGGWWVRADLGVWTAIEALS